MEPIEFRVFGTPRPQPRARAFAFNGGDGKARVRVYEAGTAENWKSCVADAARQHVPSAPIDDPIRIDITLLFERPKYLMKKSSPQDRIPHTAKPDRDNADKAILDALKTIGMLRDDSIVCDGFIKKRYAAIGEQPGAVIRISEVTD